MHLYFVVFKSKKDEYYRLFTNTLFDDEIKAEQFDVTVDSLMSDRRSLLQEISKLL